MASAGSLVDGSKLPGRYQSGYAGSKARGKLRSGVGDLKEPSDDGWETKATERQGKSALPVFVVVRGKRSCWSLVHLVFSDV
jgi:hypothetical protein